MTAMSTIHVKFITDIFSPDLVSISNIDYQLDKELFNLPYDEIIVDFSGVNTIDVDFANHYRINKSKSNKVIHEVNIPLLNQNMFENITQTIDTHV
jgi:hypothetical protein